MADGRKISAFLLLAAILGFVPPPALRAQQGAPVDEEAMASGEDPQWPRVVERDGVTFTVYQPQIDRFSDASLEARAAVKVDTIVEGDGEKTDRTQTSYGVIWITANTQIDKETELVELTDIEITKVNFPTAPEKAEQYLAIMRANTEPTRTISLERIEANLAITQADKKAESVPLKNEPPQMYFRTSPALLILIDGDPALRPVEGAQGLQRVINSKSLILESNGTYYLSLAGAWLSATSATGPYRRASSAPAPVQAVRDAIAKDENQTAVDLLEEPGEEIESVLSEGRSPEIIVSTAPAELLVTKGKPQMKPLSGTDLLYVDNTTGDIFLDLDDQSYYVGLTGRWFRTKSLEKGPWTFVDGAKLPKDFAKIADTSPKSNVLATVPGTAASQEAVIANSIPQTAEVNREEANLHGRSTTASRGSTPFPTRRSSTPSTRPCRSCASRRHRTTACRAASGSQGRRPWVRGPSRPWCPPRSTRSRRPRRSTT